MVDDQAFMNNGRLEIDNNRSERAIKPFVIGRKTGCYFCGKWLSFSAFPSSKVLFSANLSLNLYRMPSGYINYAEHEP